MNLQQLRYVVQIAESGSISGASDKLYISQPSLSKSLADLEEEMGLRIFERSQKGVELTEEGTRFLSHARQVVEQAAILEEEYKGVERPRRVFGVSAQHYSFVVSAFVDLVREQDRSKYEFSLRESTTFGIIEDVRLLRSELGVLYRCDFNEQVVTSAIKKAGLKFTPLFTASPHVFVSKDNPLASKKQVTLADLHPYPRLTYDQGIRNSLFFAEELHRAEDADKSIVVTDRASLFNLVIGLNGYTISSGILSEELNGTSIVAVPLKSSEHMELGYVTIAGRPLPELGMRYIELLNDYVAAYREGSRS